MSGGWKGSNRKAELPPDWEARRADQLEHDGFRCTWRMPISGDRCPNKATDVDHYGSKFDNGKLRSLCDVHHAKRTAKQGNAAKEIPPFKPRRQVPRDPRDLLR